MEALLASMIQQQGLTPVQASACRALLEQVHQMYVRHSACGLNIYVNQFTDPLVLCHSTNRCKWTRAPSLLSQHYLQCLLLHPLHRWPPMMGLSLLVAKLLRRQRHRLDQRSAPTLLPRPSPPSVSGKMQVLNLRTTTRMHRRRGVTVCARRTARRALSV
jgi:hypothetical protein